MLSRVYTGVCEHVEPMHRYPMQEQNNFNYRGEREPGNRLVLYIVGSQQTLACLCMRSEPNSFLSLFTELTYVCRSVAKH